ncbi:hypothetical protein PAXRUDRAFT_19805 [Paxillus rubicundulus Ve08.2h10]|uniref:Uncharacterized protein n=1 Tax=Paxillus rubicundulus Ve08.2h10 TaxID=930991 RepID=A0A0D0BSW9_9AGAM|nr:hypothetical protein PAXRUDRAFT_19805 [Paxillus rubicundulus Ve08.2h10]
MSKGGLLLHMKLLLQNASLKWMSAEYNEGKSQTMPKGLHKWSAFKDDLELPESGLSDLEWDWAATVIAYSLLNHYTMDIDFDCYAD